MKSIFYNIICEAELVNSRLKQEEEGRKDVFLFNDELNTFSYGCMTSDIW